MARDEKLYLVMDDTANSGKEYYPPDMTDEQRKQMDDIIAKWKKQSDQFKKD